MRYESLEVLDLQGPNAFLRLFLFRFCFWSYRSRTSDDDDATGGRSGAQWIEGDDHLHVGAAGSSREQLCFGHCSKWRDGGADDPERLGKRSSFVATGNRGPSKLVAVVRGRPCDTGSTAG
jgi:hypothetical protein